MGTGWVYRIASFGHFPLFGQLCSVIFHSETEEDNHLDLFQDALHETSVFLEDCRDDADAHHESVVQVHLVETFLQARRVRGRQQQQ